MNTRGHYGTSRVGDDASQARKLRDIARVIEPRSVFYDPHAFDNDPLPGEMGTGGVVVLLAAIGAIIGIGVVGTKMKMRWF